MNCILGKNNEEIQIDTAEEYRRYTLSLAEQAHHSIDIFSQDLEAEIYNNKFFERSVFTLSKKHPNTRIRILTQDSSVAVQNGHRLIKLAQQLTSSVFIHNPSTKYKDVSAAFMVVDEIGLIHRTVATTRSYRANVNYRSPRPAEELANFFNTVWEHSTPDPQTRRVYL
jgi:hypothetical protein